MYICPVCEQTFQAESSIQKHFLACWKECHPGHHSKPAPRSEDIVEREVNDDVTNFFSSFQKE